jgi:hypothetical protein
MSEAANHSVAAVELRSVDKTEPASGIEGLSQLESVVVVCSCGWHSAACASEEEARSLHASHVTGA